MLEAEKVAISNTYPGEALSGAVRRSYKDNPGGNATGLLRFSVVFISVAYHRSYQNMEVQKEPSIPISRSTLFLLGSEGLGAAASG